MKKTTQEKKLSLNKTKIQEFAAPLTRGEQENAKGGNETVACAWTAVPIFCI